jgi:membrane protein DedA with SNARE-associated domain
MPWKRFAVANALGAICWATTVATAGAVLGTGAALMAAAGLLVAGAVGAAIAVRRQAAATEPSTRPPSARNR